MSKYIKRASLIVIFLCLLGLILFFIYYPFADDIHLYRKSIEPERITRNITLSFFTDISPPLEEEYLYSVDQAGALEHISETSLSQFKNDGHAEVSLEKRHTSLKIDTADIEGQVVDGDDAFAMERGFWYFPLSQPPGEKGNTVIIGHRFLNIPPAKDTFFNLDKIKIGDNIYINEDNGEYKYTVVETKIVDANDRSILAKTDDYRITLITCTPLWTSEKRLVIIGKLDKLYQKI